MLHGRLLILKTQSKVVSVPCSYLSNGKLIYVRLTHNNQAVVRLVQEHKQNSGEWLCRLFYKIRRTKFDLV